MAESPIEWPSSPSLHDGDSSHHSDDDDIPSSPRSPTSTSFRTPRKRKRRRETPRKRRRETPTTRRTTTSTRTAAMTRRKVAPILAAAETMASGTMEEAAAITAAMLAAAAITAVMAPASPTAIPGPTRAGVLHPTAAQTPTMAVAPAKPSATSTSPTTSLLASVQGVDMLCETDHMFVFRIIFFSSFKFSCSSCHLVVLNVIIFESMFKFVCKSLNHSSYVCVEYFASKFLL